MASFLGTIFLGLLFSVSFGQSQFLGLFNWPGTSDVDFDVDEWEDNVGVDEQRNISWWWNAEHSGRLALHNSITNTGLVIDSRTGLVALEEFKGDKAVIDFGYESGFFGKSSAKTAGEFESNLKKYDIVSEAKGTPKYPMVQAHTKTNKEIRDLLINILRKICPAFVDLFFQIKGNHIMMDDLFNKLINISIDISDHSPNKAICVVKIILIPIVYVLKMYLRIMFAPQIQAWYTFKAGLRSFLIIFKWLIKLFKASVGIAKLIKSGAKFKLNMVMEAANGALALYEILKEIGSKNNLIKIWPNLFNLPENFCKLINGLGGMVSAGVNGLFGIFSKIYQFPFGWIGTLKKFVNTILDCISGGRPTNRDIDEAADKLLEVSRRKRSPKLMIVICSVKKEMGCVEKKLVLEIRLLTVIIQCNGVVSLRTVVLNEIKLLTIIIRRIEKGKGNFKIKGLSISRLVNIIKKASATAKTTVMEIMNLLNPFAPMKNIVARLFVDTIVSLNTTKGPLYVSRLFPNIEISDSALKGTNRNLAVDLIVPDKIDLSVMNLPTTKMLRSIPIVKEIYGEFDEAALEYTNSTLEFLLTNEHVEELVEFTTTLVGLRK
ncbi:unnamed protein product [Ceutorhynchus assimilis]|uniref:Uncharacterized protein n=1 Tax=Ceutorhynchus assimilis TaxID=467358 RepID=A0A9N9MMS7_9CUCU|nr:unnamed protein product [Ceutorhynchus assimilis]